MHEFIMQLEILMAGKIRTRKDLGYDMTSKEVKNWNRKL